MKGILEIVTKKTTKKNNKNVDFLFLLLPIMDK